MQLPTAQQFNVIPTSIFRSLETDRPEHCPLALIYYCSTRIPTE